MYRVGIDIGGTKLNLGIFDAESRELVINRKAYIRDIGEPEGFICELIGELCGETGIEAGEIISCGVGIPGTVSADARRIVKAPNIDVLGDDIAVKLEERLGIPTRLIQDSRAAALGEYLCGGGAGMDTVVCVTLGTGIGTGIIMNGAVFGGALGCAGEMGHIPVVEGGRRCGCGRSGCLEKYAAGGGLDITAAELLGEGKTAADLFDAAENGDARALEALGDAVEMLGRGLVAIINLLSPNALLLSGGLCARERLYLEPLMEYIKAHCYQAGELPIIAKAALGELSPLYGAAFCGQRPQECPRV